MTLRNQTGAQATVTILLCTFNGARHLQEQLDSYCTQSYRRWRLWVSDDGSTDETPAILKAFQDINPDREVRLVAGPQAGAAANFMSLLLHPELPDDPVALSDQDDVWMPGKLERAVARIGHEQGAVHYASRTILTDAQLRPWKTSRRFPETPGFGNTLLQNYMSGNTTVLNRAALKIVRAAGVPDNIPYHDWWLSQLLSGAGARLIYDNRPGLYYRQHNGNLMGANSGIGGFVTRLVTVFSSRYRDWLRRNTKALAAQNHLLTEKNRSVLGKFCSRSSVPGWSAIREMRRAGISRQLPLHNAAFYLALLLRRI